MYMCMCMCMHMCMCMCTLALALALQAFCVVLHKLAQLLQPQGVDGLEMCNEEARGHGRDYLLRMHCICIARACTFMCMCM